MNLASYKLKYKQYGAHAVLIEWPHKIDDAIFFRHYEF